MALGVAQLAQNKDGSWRMGGFGIGLVEAIILGLVCIGLPVAIVAAVLLARPKRD